MNQIILHSLHSSISTLIASFIFFYLYKKNKKFDFLIFWIGAFFLFSISFTYKFFYFFLKLPLETRFLNAILIVPISYFLIKGFSSIFKKETNKNILFLSIISFFIFLLIYFITKKPVLYIIINRLFFTFTCIYGAFLFFKNSKNRPLFKISAILLIFYSISHYLLLFFFNRSLLLCNCILFIVTYIRLLIPLLIITEKLIESQSRLRIYNDKLNAMNITRKSFTRTLTHDVKSPIFTSMGYLDMIRQNKLGNIPENIQMILDKVIHSNKTIVEIIDLINEFVQNADIEYEIKLKKIDISEIIHKIFNQLHIYTEKDYILDFDENAKIIKNDLSVVYKILFILINKLSECSDHIHINTNKKNELLQIEINHSSNEKDLNEITNFLKDDLFKINSLIKNKKSKIIIFVFDYN